MLRCSALLSTTRGEFEVKPFIRSWNSEWFVIILRSEWELVWAEEAFCKYYSYRLSIIVFGIMLLVAKKIIYIIGSSLTTIGQNIVDMWARSGTVTMRYAIEYIASIRHFCPDERTQFDLHATRHNALEASLMPIQYHLATTRGSKRTMKNCVHEISHVLLFGFYQTAIIIFICIGWVYAESIRECDIWIVHDWTNTEGK